jgi:hypothetical protein
MALFVHLTCHKHAKTILRNGINRLRTHPTCGRVVFAMPVTRNFYVSHQWLRELKRRSRGAIVGIYFRIPDDETVWIGHYKQAHRQMMAAEAAAAVHDTGDTAEGFEVLIPRRITAKEIHRVKTLPQVIGWRYYPNSHGKHPCGCSFCQRGEYGARRVRKKFGADS